MVYKQYPNDDGNLIDSLYECNNTKITYYRSLFTHAHTDNNLYIFLYTDI